MHLATLRKACEGNPLKLLKKYKASTAGSPKPSSAPAVATAGASDNGDFRFDNLESVEATPAAEDNVGKSGTSGWTNLFGGEKRASKFAVP
jgi:hypothetical protein